jgi:hypothetical protein
MTDTIEIAPPVAVENYAYSPTSLTVTVGDTVTRTQPRPGITRRGDDHRTGRVPVTVAEHGGSWSFTSTVPGPYSYYCSVHPDMQAEIIVEPAAEAPAPAPAPAPPAASSAPPTTIPPTTGAQPQHSKPPRPQRPTSPRPDAVGSRPGRGGDDHLPAADDRPPRAMTR